MFCPHRCLVTIGSINVRNKNNMPNLHIIIGDSNTRKSSLLRCLTGLGGGNSKRFLQVMEASGNVITVYCMVAALQEDYKPMSPEDFIAHINSLTPRPNDIAFTLRVSAQGAFPSFGAYFQAFSQVGWPVMSVALLGQSACAQQSSIQCRKIWSAPKSPSQPTNQTAADVRNAWQWV